MAINLQNVKLSAKLRAGDMVALEAKYHKSYLTTLSNKPHSTRLKAAKVDDDEKIRYIEESQGESKSVLVFKIAKLSEMYTSRLKHLGIVQPSALHSTRLKNRILASIPSLRAYQQGRDMLLAFNSNTGTAWQQVSENYKHTDANYLAKAATIVTKEMLATTSTFKGTFQRQCQENSNPSSLVSLAKMILYGPNNESLLKNSSSQAALTVAHIL